MGTTPLVMEELRQACRWACDARTLREASLRRVNELEPGQLVWVAEQMLMHRIANGIPFMHTPLDAELAVRVAERLLGLDATSAGLVARCLDWRFRRDALDSG